MSEDTETTTLQEAKAKNAPFSSSRLHLSRRHGLSETAETIALIIPLGVHSLENRHTTHTPLFASGSLLDRDRELSQRTIPC